MNKGIYCIKNVITNKMYIGSSINISKRFYHHKKMLLNNIHHSIKLQNSYNKHGIDNFVFEILEIVDDKLKLIETEQKYIDTYNTFKCGYNSRAVANSPLGTKLTEEQKKKISEFHKNRIRQPMSEETKLKLSIINKGKIGANLGKKQTEETKQKISDSKKGKKSKRNNFKHTDEQKENWSKERKGIKNNPNYIQHSEETKQKMKDYIKLNGSAKSKKCKVDNTIFINAKEAALHLNIKYHNALYKFNSINWPNWIYL